MTIEYDRKRINEIQFRASKGVGARGDIPWLLERLTKALATIEEAKAFRGAHAGDLLSEKQTSDFDAAMRLFYSGYECGGEWLGFGYNKGRHLWEPVFVIEDGRNGVRPRTDYFRKCAGCGSLVPITEREFLELNGQKT